MVNSGSYPYQSLPEDFQDGRKWKKASKYCSKSTFIGVTVSSLLIAFFVIFFEFVAAGTKTYTIVIFGDSLVRRTDNYWALCGNIRKNLVQLFPDYRFDIYSSGIDGNRILDLRNRLDNDCLKRPVFQFFPYIWYLPAPDAVIMYWDSDASDPENPFDEALQQDYIINLDYVLSTIKSQVSYLAVGGPTLLGELPPGTNSGDGAADLYREINRNITSFYNITYIETRESFQSQLPENWDQPTGYLTLDGEHHNQRGAEIILNLFTRAVSNWLNGIQVKKLYY